MIATTPDAPGVATSQRAAKFWSEEWAGESFMAVGMTDKMLGPEVMGFMRTMIKGCPPPLEIANGGHFVQESGGPEIARKALEHFGLARA